MAKECTLTDLPKYYQDNHYWCWAACAQVIIHARTGIHVAQERIVLDRYDKYSRPPNITGWPRFDKRGLEYFTVDCKPLDRPLLEGEFCAQRPVMIAANGHMVVGYGITADSRWDLLIHDPSGEAWTRWPRSSYRSWKPITYYEFGVAATKGPTVDGDDYCAGKREAVAAEEAAWTDAELAGGMDAEIAAVVRLFQQDHPQVPAEALWTREPPLRIFRQSGPGRARLNRVLFPFRLAERWGGGIAVRPLAVGDWVPFSAEVSDFARVAIAVAGGRRRRGEPVDILERVQGLYDWIRVDEPGAFEGWEPLDIRPELRRDHLEP